MSASGKTVLILYQSASTACGIGTWVEGLSQALTLKGWSVVVGLAWGNRFHDPEKIEQFRPALNTIRMDGRSGTVEGRIQAIEHTILKVKPDVVVLTVLDAAFEAVSRLRYQGEHFRLVAVNHGNLPGQAACLLEHRDIIDMAVCVSRLSYEAMGSVAESFPEDRLCHIPNAVTVSGRVSRHESASSLHVGYVGRLDGDKRAEDLFPFYEKLHALCPSAKLLVAGRGEQEDALRALEHACPAQVQYFGELSRGQLDNEFYPELDILVHFSPSEAWGYSIAEALAHGVAVVTSEFRGVHADGLVLPGENAEVFPVGEPCMAAEIVAGLDADRVRLTQMKERAGKHIEAHFSLDCFGELWSEALQQSLSLPELDRPPRPATLDRKGKFGISASAWERIRKAFSVRIDHGTPGEEWPHFQCHNRVLMNELAQSLERSGKKVGQGQGRRSVNGR